MSAPVGWRMGFTPAAGELLDIWELKAIPGKGMGVVAAEPIPACYPVATCGVVSIQTWRDARSIQVLPELHVHVESPGCWFNHSCAPNMRVRDVWPCQLDGQERFELAFISLRAIEEGEELTWHYGTSEAVSIAVEACACGKCDGKRVRGFREVDRVRQDALRKLGVMGYLEV